MVILSSCSPMSLSLTRLSFLLQPKPKALTVCVRRRNGSAAAIPARDRVIGFGKHKGKMLGSLPSSYLKWVSKNLRAREFEEWAILADQVLEDPVYQDRIQWEFAQNILSGSMSNTRATGDNVISELLEISERFGWDWDNAHKAGWRDVNFELLGTSKGGRIPRRNKATATATETNPESKMMTKQNQNVSDGGGTSRERRRDRLRVKRQQQSQSKSEAKTTPNAQIDNTRIRNPFPGRQTLLNSFTTTK